MSRRVAGIAALALLGVAAVAAVALARSGDDATAAETAHATTTATVVRRDLVVRESFDGTLGYADPRPVTAASSGTVTGLRNEGAIVRRSGVLYEVDGIPVRLLYGAMPLWRRLAAGVEDGRDVKQLERNLQALGYDPGTVDDAFTSGTTSGLKAWQGDLGVAEDGALDPGEAVFLPGARRIGTVGVAVGGGLQPGAEVMQTTAVEPVVTVDLDAREQSIVRRGQAVSVELPSGRVVAGTVARIASVAETSTDAQGQPGNPTIPVTITVRNFSRRDRLDGAPVTVNLETSRARDVLAVPVEGLLALAGGGFAVEVVGADGARSLVAVETGAFADGWVEVKGRSMKAGTRVAVPA